MEIKNETDISDIADVIEKAKAGNGTTLDDAIMSIPGKPYEYPGEFIELVVDMVARVIAGNVDEVKIYGPAFLAHCFHIIETTGYAESLKLRDQLVGSALMQLQQQMSPEQVVEPEVPQSKNEKKKKK